MGFGVWGLGFGVWGFGFWVWGLGFGVWGLRVRARGVLCKDRAWGLGVWRSGMEVYPKRMLATLVLNVLSMLPTKSLAPTSANMSNAGSNTCKA